MIFYNTKSKNSDKIEKIFSNILTNREILLKYLLVQLSKKYLTVDAQYTTGGRLGFRLVKENETLDSALRRFKRNCAKAGIQQEIRKREHYEKPSVKRKKKSEAARKRKYN